MSEAGEHAFDLITKVCEEKGKTAEEVLVTSNIDSIYRTVVITVDALNQKDSMSEEKIDALVDQLQAELDPSMTEAAVKLKDLITEAAIGSLKALDEARKTQSD